MKTIFIYFFWFLCVSSPKFAFCQVLNPPNLVPNSSFEHGDSNKPDGLGQLQNADDWKNINSPDWYRETPNHFYSNYADPRTGSAFVGFSKSEGMKVQLTNSITSHNMVSISFWFNPESSFDMEIHFFLRTSQNNVIDGDGYPDLNMENSYHLVVPVLSSGPNAPHPQGVWQYYQSEPFLYLGEEEPNWLVITGNPPGDTYVYLDDVELKKFPPCYHACVEDDGPLRIQTTMDSYLYEEPDGANAGSLVITPDNNPDVITGVVGNSFSNFFMTIQNATRVRFVVFSNASQPIWIEDSYDYNFLADDGYNDFALVWNGETLGGGNLQAGVYNYTVTVWQCSGPTIEIVSWMYFELNNPPASPGLGSRVNASIDDCCVEDLKFQNIGFVALTSGDWQREDADNTIRAGSNVDSNAATGPVTINAGSKVAFYAGTSISLEEGFAVIAGAQFEVALAPCGFFPRNSFPNRRIYRPKSEQIERAHKFECKVFPTLVSGYFNVQTWESIEKVEIYSSSGSLLKIELLNTSESKIDMSALPPGLYFVLVKSFSEVSNFRIIKQ